MQSHTIYNSLPSVEVANAALPFDFDATLAKVEHVFRPHGTKFGLCLTHRHFALQEGEIMVENANDVMKPEAISTTAYAKRWTRDGTPYEYSAEPQNEVSAELLRAFKQVVPAGSFLGIYSRAGDDETSSALVEVCNENDRSHYRESRPSVDESDLVYTSWFSPEAGRPMMRGSVCIRITVNGADKTHISVPV